MIEQVIAQCPGETNRDSLARKLYRHRVANVNNWEFINKDKIVSMNINLIPQKQAKLEQVINNRINDSWNEPTIIRVLIINEEHKPTQSEYVHDQIQDQASFILFI